MQYGSKIVESVYKGDPEAPEYQVIEYRPIHAVASDQDILAAFLAFLEFAKKPGRHDLSFVLMKDKQGDIHRVRKCWKEIAK